MNTPCCKNENGYTLFEVVVASIVFGILGVIAVGVIANQSESFNQVLNQTVALTDSRKVIQMLRRDIQNLTVSNINTMNSDEFDFTNNDGDEIVYEISGSDLIRNDDIILSGLTAGPFSYLNIDQETTGVQDSVKFIGVNLSILRNSESVVMEEIIYARN